MISRALQNSGNSALLLNNWAPTEDMDANIASRQSHFILYRDSRIFTNQTLHFNSQIKIDSHLMHTHTSVVILNYTIHKILEHLQILKIKTFSNHMYV